MGGVEKKKIIIDTDPGIDDAMAIFVALRSPEVEVIGLTTIYGNVYTTLATRNALHLLEFAERSDIPVAEGSHVTIMKTTKLRIADFVHERMGLETRTSLHQREGKLISQPLLFLLNKQIYILERLLLLHLAHLQILPWQFNLIQSSQKRSGKLLFLEVHFQLMEMLIQLQRLMQIFGDPDAADIVFTSGADVVAVGINVTHQVVLTDADRDKLAQSGGKYAQYLSKILGFYYAYHHDAYAIQGVYLHDPTTLLAAVNPSLLTYTEGVVRVQTTGIMRGLTIFHNSNKSFGEQTEWSHKPTVKVAVTVDAPATVKLIMERLMNS